MKKQYIAVDGNTAASRIAYKMSDMAVIYPITPSSPMAENVDEMRTKGEKNVFGSTVQVTEMQSEAGAAGALHGALTSGSLTTTFTSSQGLLLMIPNMYKIAGELLPCVIHVAARTVATHALSIFGDHSDVYAARSTGFALLCSSSVQEAQDFALAAHLATLESRVPFLHFFDGFRTSHEINKIEKIDDETIRHLVDFDLVSAIRREGLSSDMPTARGTAQNPDVFFQNREACNSFYAAVPEILKHTFAEIAEHTGRKYRLFDYYGDPTATHVFVAMGSGCETIEETIDYLLSKGEKVGLVKVRLFRPFSIRDFAKALPKTTQVVTVLDRAKESGAVGEPLYEEVCSALREANISCSVLGGRYGISSKDFTPAMVNAVLENMKSAKPKNHFTVGITDDVTNASLKVKSFPSTLPEGTVECKFFGLGSDGTVSANKSSIKIIAENTPLFAQAYFEYDSKKAGSVTVSHLRFGKKKIKSTYQTQNADIVACHNPGYLFKFDVLESIKKNGIFLLNSPWEEEKIEKHLPGLVKRTLAKKNARLFFINADEISKEVGMAGKINMVMQTAFFKLLGIIPEKRAIELIKDFARKTYGRKGENVIKMNLEAIDLAANALKEYNVPKEWAKCEGELEYKQYGNEFVEEIMQPISQRKGDNLPVSAFLPNGEVPTGTSAYEKRSISLNLPKWIAENCIQCNQCSLVCPHACIRPYLVKSGSALSKKLGAIPSKLSPGNDFAICLSAADCTGCGNCAHVCPAIKKALEMVKTKEIYRDAVAKYEMVKQHENPSFANTNAITSQFKKPLFEFSGACAGCGETPYIKLLTQLFGDRLTIANATGCSSIYGGSYPTCPYTKNDDGRGPAWANSLFEDNAEFSFGMLLSHKNAQKQIEEMAKSQPFGKKLNELLGGWLDGDHSVQMQQNIIKQAKLSKTESAKQLLALSSGLTDKSFWAIGGDGWAYDIGFGGIDHVLSSGEKVRILVLDTEVYSNTGGQSSKSSPLGSVAKFAASGKQTAKKDMLSICMNYPGCYVASVSLGANMAQCVNAFLEAEANDGPSIIFAYAPCQNHGIDMSKTPEIQKNAVTSGYFALVRHNPSSGETRLDPPFATKPYQEFLQNENRYKSLEKQNPELAKKLFEMAEKQAKERIEKYKK